MRPHCKRCTLQPGNHEIDGQLLCDGCAAREATARLADRAAQHG